MTAGGPRRGTASRPGEVNWTKPSGAVLQVGVPAREFWNDIYFT
ncbi:MAG: hypothetical protein AAB284_08155 [Chloroflexota bacterium]